MTSILLLKLTPFEILRFTIESSPTNAPLKTNKMFVVSMEYVSLRAAKILIRARVGRS